MVKIHLFIFSNKTGAFITFYNSEYTVIVKKIKMLNCVTNEAIDMRVQVQ